MGNTKSFTEVPQIMVAEDDGAEYEQMPSVPNRQTSTGSSVGGWWTMEDVYEKQPSVQDGRHLEEKPSCSLQLLSCVKQPGLMAILGLLLIGTGMVITAAVNHNDDKSPIYQGVGIGTLIAGFGGGIYKLWHCCSLPKPETERDVELNSSLVTPTL